MTKVKSLEFGDVVLLKFPFTDGIGFKRRPALLINSFDDGDIIVCRITSQIYETGYDIKIDNWVGAGLKLASVIRVHKIASLEADLVESKLGRIETLELEKVKEILSTITQIK